MGIFQKITLPFSRFAIFLVYFWFGALKVFNESPANPLVASYLERMLPGMSFTTFIVLLGLFEMLIGVLFLFGHKRPYIERLGFTFLILHLVMVISPLLFLPEVAWSGFFVPTLEGQYMIKNILIIAVAISIISQSPTFKKNV